MGSNQRLQIHDLMGGSLSWGRGRAILALLRSFLSWFEGLSLDALLRSQLSWG